MNACQNCGKPTINKRVCSPKCWYSMMSTPQGIALVCTPERQRKVKLKAKERMLSDNPMKTLECRQKVSRLLKEMGHSPKVRGGNGTGPTKAEWQLIRMFPDGKWNYGINTGKWNGSGYPPCYKVDLAFPEIKLAIEADGSSHGNWDNRKQKDQKKDNFLKGLGWTVLRYTNRMILGLPFSVAEDIQSIISKLRAIPPTA